MLYWAHSDTGEPAESSGVNDGPCPRLCTLCRGDSPKAVEAPVAAAPGEPMDINTAIQLVLKKSLAHDGLARGAAGRAGLLGGRVTMSDMTRAMC